MREHQIHERLSKIQSSTVKATQGIVKSAGESAKKLSSAHTLIANNVAKNIQLKSVELLSSKSPADVASLFDYEKSSELIQDMAKYHKELHTALNEFSQAISESTQEMLQNTKIGIDEVFNVICSNAPNGTDVLIRPYQSALHSVWQGIEQVNSHMQNLLKALDGLSEGPFQSFDGERQVGSSSRKNRGNTQI